MRKTLLPFLLAFATLVISTIPHAQAYIITTNYYPAYAEGGIVLNKGQASNMIGDRYTGTIRFNSYAYGVNPYESEVYAWMIQSWSASGGEQTTINAYTRLQGLIGKAGLGLARLTLTLKAWWKETRWSGQGGTYATTSKVFEAGEEKWFSNQAEKLTISFYNPWKSGRDDDGSVYSLKMGLYVTGYTKAGWWPYPLPATGQGYLYFYTFGSNPCYIVLDRFEVIRSA